MTVICYNKSIYLHSFVSFILSEIHCMFAAEITGVATVVDLVVSKVLSYNAMLATWLLYFVNSSSETLFGDL